MKNIIKKKELAAPCCRRPFRWWGVGPLPKRWNITGSYSCLGSQGAEKLCFFWLKKQLHSLSTIRDFNANLFGVVCCLWHLAKQNFYPIPYHGTIVLYIYLRWKIYKINPSCRWTTPWKIIMEPTNHPFSKENDLPNLQKCMFQPLIFRSVYQSHGLHGI